MSREEIIDALIAERYSPPSWWKTPPTNAALPDERRDDALTQARRRRQLAEAWGAVVEEASA